MLIAAPRGTLPMSCLPTGSGDDSRRNPVGRAGCPPAIVSGREIGRNRKHGIETIVVT
jgi:hypothetical protein